MIYLPGKLINVHPLKQFKNFEVNIGGKAGMHLEPYQKTVMEIFGGNN